MKKLVFLLTTVLLLIVSCGVPKDDYAAVQGQLAAKEKEVSSLRQQLEVAQAQGQNVATLQEQINAKEKEIATLKQRTVWSIIPEAPPRQPPPPPQPGTTPPPPPVPPAPKTVPIYFYVDTVTAGPGESKFNVDANLSCVITGVFKRGMHIVWRMEAVDTSTGKILQAADVESAVLKHPNGETLNFRYGRHGATEDAPWFWTVAWDVPMDYPLGVVDFSVELTTKDGKKGAYKQIPVSLPARNIESRLMIIE